MYNRNEGKALAISRVEFRNKNCSARSSAQKHDIVTTAKCAKGYHFTQTYLSKCLNSEVFEGYTFNGVKFGPNLFEFLLFNNIENRFLYIKCKEHSIDCTSALMFVLSIPRLSRNAIEVQTVS